ncbi:MAG TPA: hypothetical protein DDW71_00615 [Lactobacillus sp.]|nr:hypothetical protein [Lactobacillus sp.]
MSLIYDKSNAGLSVTEPGVYEVYPTSWHYHISGAGNNVIDLDYRVRTDVEQSFQGATINYDSYNDSPKAKYRIDRFISCLIPAVPDHKDFETIQNWAKQMMGCAVRVQVVMETNNNGKTYATVKSVMQSAKPEIDGKPFIVGEIQENNQRPKAKAPSSADPFTNNADTVDVSDDDLPF